MTATARILQLIRALPRFILLLMRLMADRRISAADRGLLAAAVLYALSPVDLVPDTIPVLGQLDDLYLIALAIDRLIRRADPDVIRGHWDGPPQLLETLRGSLDQMARLLPTGVRRDLARRAENR